MVAITVEGTERGSNLPMLTPRLYNKYRIVIAHNYINRYHAFNHFKNHTFIEI